MTQKNLSPRQHRWLDVLNEFQFEIHYIPGETNTVADALSRIYSDEPTGTVRAESEYVGPDGMEEEPSPFVKTSLASVNEEPSTELLYTSLEDMAEMAQAAPLARRSSRLAEKPRREISRKTHLPMKGPDEGVLIPVIKRKRGRPPKAKTEVENLPEVLKPQVEKGEGKQEGMSSHTTTNQEELEPEEDGLLEAVSADLPKLAIPAEIKGRYGNDTYFSVIERNPEHHKQFEIKEGLIYLEQKGRRLLTVPDLTTGDRRKLREVLISNAHSILAHLGSGKTLTYLRESVWWPSMVKDVQDYCKSCKICMMSKPSTQKPMGLLKPLDVPHFPWQSIGIDFVGPLPASRNRHGEFDMICVIIDRLTSMVHLVPSKQDY